ncbi:DUF305 domain-containing protein [bacterium]|nr:DUF305 domain-containing protein [bacterium]
MLVLGTGIGYTLTQSSVGRGGMHMMSGGSEMRQNIDQHFIVQMIPHHEGAIAMAEIALERSKRPEIISLANGIIEAQEREIAEMKSWYQDWFGSAPPQGGMGTEHGMHMDGMTGDNDELRSVSDAQFDREFIDQMIPHHEMAVMMASMLESSTARDEMRTLADNIITSQSREIEMMRIWRTSWYGN